MEKYIFDKFQTIRQVEKIFHPEAKRNLGTHSDLPVDIMDPKNSWTRIGDVIDIF